MKPKMYRKTKGSSGSDIGKFKPNMPGGVEGVIIGPESSVGTVASTPSADQGDEKGILKPPGFAPNPKEPAYISGRRGLV